MIYGKILDIYDLRKYIASMLNTQFDVNISANNIRLDIDDFKSGFMPYNYTFDIGIELGSRLPVKPLSINITHAMAIISYVKKSTKGGYEYNEVMTITSFIDASMFSI